MYIKNLFFTFLSISIFFIGCSDSDSLEVQPNEGPQTGGMEVTIIGSDFSSKTKVTFDGVEAKNVRVVNPTKLLAQIPASISQKPGSSEIKVTTEAMTLTADFNYLPVEIIVGNQSGSIVTFPVSAEGNTSPSRQISGKNTALTESTGVSQVNNELIVTNSSADSFLLAFDSKDTGDVAPKRAINSDKKQRINLVATMIDNKEIFAVEQNKSGIDRILVFNLNDSGSVAPKRILMDATGPDNNPSGLFILKNDLFVSSASGKKISVFNKTDSGSVAPKHAIEGSDTTLNEPAGIFVVDNEIFVANSGNNRILVFNQNDKGDISPRRVILGNATQLSQPKSVFVTTNGELIVSNGNNKILVFNKTDHDNTPPKRVIFGVGTGLNNPGQIYVTNTMKYLFPENTIEQTESKQAE